MSTDAQMDYKDTVLTPRTEFPQKGGLPQREPQLLEHWKTMGLAAKTRTLRGKSPHFVLHDGPPYANGHIHIGHALNKVLKDLVVRYKTLAGFQSNYVPGWDCHGLPIEQKVMEELAKAKEKVKDPLEVRKRCAEYAKKWAVVQSEEFQRLGIGGEWDKPYMTLTPEYEQAIVRALGEMVKRGLVFKGFKPVHWDPVFETALAEAEIEYEENHVSPSIYVRFPLVKEGLPEPVASLKNPTIVIWTTTPWTLPANMGVCVGAEHDYVAYECEDETFIIAEAVLSNYQDVTGFADGKVVAKFKGRILDRTKARHPIFDNKTSLVMLGEHVLLEYTGCVHTAPAHGVEDFHIGRQYGLEVFSPVDARGRYTDLYPEMVGVSVFDANTKVVDKLRNEGKLVWAGKVTHSYPYSWRSRKPTIQRATEQWFVDLDKNGLREKAMAEIEKVQWIPPWGKDRIRNMVEGRPDWCLSRQRAWGVPIPSILDKKTNSSLLTAEIVEKFASYVATEGTDCWFTRPVEDFLPDNVEKETGRYEKEQNILDVWFDSGASHLGVLEPRANLNWPADLYLEGSDQHRGWFQSSLWVAVGVKDAAPYRAVLTHGFVLDGKGQPMSKSLGNVIAPADVIKDMGADVLRLWVASEEYRSDLAMSKDILNQVANVYRRIRNTIRFLLGNLFDFNPATDRVAYANMDEDDRWALGALGDLVTRVREAYDAYEFHVIYHLVNGFCVTELGGIYLDCAKDRLYCSAPNDRVRRACQTVLYDVATSVLGMLAPIIPFTTEEAWLQLPADPARAESVHLTNFPVASPEWKNEPLMAEWKKLLAIRSEVQKAIEPLRAKENKVIGNSLEAQVVLTAVKPDTVAFLKAKLGQLARLFIVSKVVLNSAAPAAPLGELINLGMELEVKVQRSEAAKCERCWTYTETVGTDSHHPTLCDRCADAVRRKTA